MSTKESIEVNNVVNQLARLKKSQRMAVLKKLVHLIDTPEPSKKSPKLTDLAGVGKEIWEKIDVDKYIRDLRNEWD